MILVIARSGISEGRVKEEFRSAAHASELDEVSKTRLKCRKSVSTVDLGIVMKIDGVPDGFEIRTVYDAQGLADACVSGQKLQPGERVVCAIIRPVSDEEFVTQDRVPDRPEIDEWRWVYGCRSPGDWRKSSPADVVRYMHGTIERGDRFEIRCRRKDLPAIS